MRRRFLTIMLTVAVAVAVSTGAAVAKDVSYPTKPVTIVYHSQAGSGGDIFLRQLAKAMEPILGQPIVIENRTGGGGSNAWTYVKNAKPDGYTLLGISSSILAGPLQTKMSVSYKDFKPVAQVFFDPTVIYTSANSKFKTFEDIINHAKANPGQQTWGAGNPGSAETMCIEKIAQLADMKITVVPFEGGADVMVEIIAGRIDAAIGEYAEIASQVEAGNIKLICNLNSERMQSLPDLPTLKESGIDFVFEKMRGILAPNGTPDEVIQVWVDGLQKVYDDPAFRKYYEENKLVPRFRPTDEMQKAMDEQYEFFKEMSKGLY